VQVFSTSGAAPYTATADANGERALIGVPLHPQFASNDYVYLYYTTAENGAHNRVSRFTANPADTDVALANSELRTADLPALSSAANHNGGAMRFGLDGSLYLC
jgi:glucose/arabinose dehydrogenase